MFDQIAPRYDLMNSLMSLGLHRLWRRRAIASLLSQQGREFLDIGCGTGDVMLAVLRKAPGVSVTGLDPAPDMLARAQTKLQQAGVAKRARLVEGDATAMEFAATSFDGIVCAFCLRNIVDRATALKQMRRVLRPGGTLALLELTVPRNPLCRFVHSIYTRHLIPLLGRLLSQGHAYRYLAASIDHFPPPATMVAEIGAAGFAAVSAQPLSGGFVTLFTGRVAKGVEEVGL